MKFVSKKKSRSFTGTQQEDIENPISESLTSENLISETPISDNPISETPISESTISETPITKTPTSESPLSGIHTTPNTQESAALDLISLDQNPDSSSINIEVSPTSGYRPPSFPHPFSDDTKDESPDVDRYATERPNGIDTDLSTGFDRYQSSQSIEVNASESTAETNNMSTTSPRASSVKSFPKYPRTNLSRKLSTETYAESCDEESAYHSMGMETHDSSVTKLKPTYSYNTHGDDYYYVKQKIAFCSISISVVQLLILSLMMALCGVAPFDVNPMIGPYPDTLSMWGGKNLYDLSTNREWWKMFTPFALHSGIIHLFFNLAIQLETGAFFEREWGSTRWLTIYIFSAFGSMLSNYIFNPDTVSVGSSGPIMGLFGAKMSEILSLSMFETVRHERDLGDYVRLEQMGGILCSSIFVGLFAFIPYVEWSGHMGGLFAGFITGIIVFSKYINNWTFTILWGGTGLFTFVFLSVVGLKFLFFEVDVDFSLSDPCEKYAGLHVDGYNCGCF